MQTSRDSTSSEVRSGEVNGSVEDKVRHLENSLDILRAEVDMKMYIMEQILSTRNEQFVVQKKLIEREHALYESVMTHWKNTAELAATGQSIRFSSTTQNFHVFENTNENPGPIPTKRTSQSAYFNPAAKRIRIRAKRFRGGRPTFGKIERAEESNSLDPLSEGEDTNDTPQSNAEDLLDLENNSGGESDDADYDEAPVGSGMEKRVFVNFFAVEPSTPEEGSSDPIWLNFLREEGQGATALCRHCDAKGFQKIYKLRTPSMAVLRKHLKRTHKIIVEAPPLPVPEEIKMPAQDRGQNRRRLMPFLRHNDHLYTRYTHRNFVEYWRCREKTCSGKIVKRNGVVQSTGEHNCLTTRADCDAIIFREKIRELAETEPTLPPADIIAAAKFGLPEDVLDLVPNDESLRRTIRRIRLALVSSAPSASDWT